MKKTLKAISSLSFCVASGVTAFAFLSNYEIFNRNAKLPAKINVLLKKKQGNDKRSPDERVDWLNACEPVEYEIKGVNGEKLKAFFIPSDKPCNTFVVCSHGYRNQGRGEFKFITKYYHDSGYNVLLLDHPAAGESEGKYITFGKNESESILLWLDFLKREFGGNIQIILHGVSMGAGSVLMLTDRKEILPQVKYVISDCSFDDLYGLFTYIVNKWKIPKINLDIVLLIQKLFYGNDLKSLCPMSHVEHSLVPILFVHGKKDDFVPPFMTYSNYDACTSEKDILFVENANHANSYFKNSKAYEEKIERFSSLYITE